MQSVPIQPVPIPCKGYYLPDAGGEPVVETLGIVPFIVTGVAALPISAPALNGIGLWILVLGLGRRRGALR